MVKVFSGIGQVCVEEAFVLYLLLLVVGLFIAYACRGKDGFFAWLVTHFSGFLLVVVCVEGLSQKEQRRESGGYFGHSEAGL